MASSTACFRAAAPTTYPNTGTCRSRSRRTFADTTQQLVTVATSSDVLNFENINRAHDTKILRWINAVGLSSEPSPARSSSRTSTSGTTAASTGSSCATRLRRAMAPRRCTPQVRLRLHRADRVPLQPRQQPRRRLHLHGRARHVLPGRAAGPAAASSHFPTCCNRSTSPIRRARARCPTTWPKERSSSSGSTTSRRPKHCGAADPGAPKSKRHRRVLRTRACP